MTTAIGIALKFSGTPNSDVEASQNSGTPNSDVEASQNSGTPTVYSTPCSG